MRTQAKRDLITKMGRTPLEGYDPHESTVRLRTKKGPRARRGAPPGENAPSRPAASWSPTGWTRSTIGARGLNFRVRDGTGCASPAMAAGRLGAFCLRGGPTVPWGPHSARKRRFPGTAHGKGMRRSSAD